MALNLTPEQQEIFDRVVGIVTQNDELRHQFKSSNEELRKQPNWDDSYYLTDSEELPAVNARAASEAIHAEVKKIVPNLEHEDFWLFDDICISICHNFIGVNKEE